MANNSKFTDEELIDICFNFHPERIGYSPSFEENSFELEEGERESDRMPSNLKYDGEWINFQIDGSGAPYRYNVNNPACVRAMLIEIFYIEPDSFFNPHEYPDLLLEECNVDSVGRYV